MNSKKNEADVFSRGSIKLTYDLLRKQNPSLALIIRNIASGIPLSKASAQHDNKNADHFRVQIDSFQVRSVVEGLLQHSELSNNPGETVITKSLVEDWTKLAQKMVADLTRNEESIDERLNNEQPVDK